MQKPSLAFVDHSFHKKTHSSDFLRELFRESFDVHEYWDESWEGGPSVPAEALNAHDYAFFLQVMSPVSELEKVRVPMLWSPMYDGFKFDYAYLKILSNFDLKILSFSKRMTAWLAQFPIPVLTVQYYYLAPEERIDAVPGARIFFWYRGGITFDDLRPILDPRQIDSFTLLEVPDAAGDALAISPEDLREYKITRLSEAFLSRERYLELVRAASIFVAPRKKEGIGAFTEALILGRCVIAYDDAVHNEYISDGVDGFLFTGGTGTIDLSRAAECAQAAAQRAAAGYARWLTDRPKIIPFLQEPYRGHHSAFSIRLWSLFQQLWRMSRKARYYGSKLRGA